MNCPHGVPIDDGPACGACVRGEPPTPGARDRTFTMRMTDVEWQRLQRQSRDLGLNASSYLRMLLKLEHDRLVREGKAPPLRRVRR
jgi:hypothetical protein